MASGAALLDRRATRKTRVWVGREAEQGVEADISAKDTTLADMLHRPKISASWHGDAAASMGLEGEAKLDDIKSVLEDGVGANGELLRSNGVKRVSYSFIFTAPKSISALLASSNPDVLSALDDAMRIATDEYIRSLEQVLTSRSGKTGTYSVPIAGVAAAAWHHRTTSMGDPHLHAHIIMSATAPSVCDGKWRTVDSKMVFAAKRVAEAAALYALQRHLNAAFRMSVEDWNWVRTGSTFVPEIATLQAFNDQISGVKKRLEEVIEQEFGKILDRATWAERMAAWRKHRKDKAGLAESVEHELDDALAEGGDRATAVRKVWAQRLGQQAIDHISRFKVFSASHLPTFDYDSIGEWTAAQSIRLVRENANEREARLASDRDIVTARKMLTALELPPSDIDMTALRQNEDVAKNHLRKLTREEAHYREIDEARSAYRSAWHSRKLADSKSAVWREAQAALADAEAASDLRHAEEVDYWAAVEGRILDILANQHGGWTTADVAALLMRESRGKTRAAYRLASLMMRKWQSQQRIHCPDHVAETTDEMLRRDGEAKMHTVRLHGTLGLHARSICHASIEEEIVLRDRARVAAEVQRTVLPVDVTHVSGEQLDAARIAARGRGLTVLTGVAGAGKSQVLRPVAVAARELGLDIIVTARNAKRARELGFGLPVQTEFMSLAKLRRTKVPDGALIIVDEGGLVDRPDFLQILELVDTHGCQVIVTGDREQQQSIDRSASWQVVVEGADQVGQVVNLRKSWRCKAWEAEADAIRVGNADAVLSAAEKRGTRSVRFGSEGDEAIADLVETLKPLRESMVVVCRTNHEAADISAAIQRKRGIRPFAKIKYDNRAGIGDIVRTRMNCADLSVMNSDEWKVVGHDINGDLFLEQISDMKGRAVAVRVPAEYVREHVELAYAGTVDSLQGVTVDRAIPVINSSNWDRQLLYSAATRGRQGPIWIVRNENDDIKPGGELRSILSRDGRARTAAEIVAEIEKSNAIDSEGVSFVLDNEELKRKILHSNFKK